MWLLIVVIWYITHLLIIYNYGPEHKIISFFW